jgi:RNA-directed DNA polymerase
MHEDKHLIQVCKEKIVGFLTPLGLELSTERTRLTHTLHLEDDDTFSQGFDGRLGFNVLDFTIKQFYSKRQSSKDSYGNRLEFKTFVYPSKESINSYQQRLHNIILKQGKSFKQEDLIQRLNPVIRRWTSYFGRFDANTFGVLSKMDYLCYLKLRRWAKRIKGTSGKGKDFWRKADAKAWVFSTKDNKLLSHMDCFRSIARQSKKFDRYYEN